jgi:tRNA-specific 2-thiouridylase
MKTLVAMSGGVDSSVAAWLVSTAYGAANTWGVHMLLNQDLENCNLKTRSCCGTADAEDARVVAQDLGIFFDAIPMYERFQKAVIDNFIAEYAAGRTPIPCTHCNGQLKFKLLLEYADLMGYDQVATGHYVGQDLDGRLWMANAVEKDQSYYLWQIRHEVLSRICFPIGSFSGKDEVRAIAATAGIKIHQKPDSQNICFIPAGNYRKVLEERAPDLFSPRTGPIVADGEVVGSHTGYWGYTLGQRVRLPGGTQKLYVTGIHPETNTVMASCEPQQALSTNFLVSDFNWHHAEPVRKGNFWIKTSAHAVPVEATLAGNQVTTAVPVRAAPGQACVFYTPGTKRGYKLEGGGWIR